MNAQSRKLARTVGLMCMLVGVLGSAQLPAGGLAGAALHDETRTPHAEYTGAAKNQAASLAAFTGVVATIPVLSSPHGVIVNPTTNRIYVTAFQSGKIQAIDGSTNTVFATTFVGSNPHSIAVNPNTDRVFVTNNGSHSVSVVDGTSLNPITTIPGINTNPVGIAVDSTRNRAYTVHGGDKLSVIDGANNTVAGVINTGSPNSYVAVNSTTNRAYVTKNQTGKIAVIDLSTSTKGEDIVSGGSLEGIAVNETTNRIFVANSAGNAVIVIDGALHTVITSIPVGTRPTDIAVNQKNNCIYAANAGSNSVSIINGETNQVVGIVPVGQDPKSVAVNPITGFVYVADRGSNTVSVIQDTSCITNTPTPDATFNKKVYILVYDPILSDGQSLSARLGWEAHTTMTQGTIDFFKQVTNNRLNYSVAYTTVVTDGWPEKIDGFRYTEQQFLDVMANPSHAHQPDAVNYTKIINTPAFDICGKLNRGEIDELWIYNGPAFGFYESLLVGPNGYWFNSPPLTTGTSCNKLLPVMGPSPEVGLPNTIHNFGHRTEATMTEVYGSWLQSRVPTHNWERFALNKSKSQNSTLYSGCGDTHFPPNATQDYIYTSTTPVDSTCDDFKNYPSLGDPSTTAKPVTCAAWGCNALGYYQYWFGHLPAFPGCGPDGYANDWWKYIAEPSLALTPTVPCQAAPTLPPALSINFTSGGPGSFFTITGSNFPANSTATIKINNVTLETLIQTDSTGSFTIILNTSLARIGRYLVTITATTALADSGQDLVTVAVNPSATLLFVLDPNQPVRPQAGNGTLIVVPVNSGSNTIFLPSVYK